MTPSSSQTFLKLSSASERTTMAKKSLPCDIIMNILSRLAVKDLLRYRCVSKPWCSLIDGPDFIKLHLNHSNQTNSNLAAVLFRDNNLTWVDLDALGPAVKLTHPIDDGHRVEVMGSCNGLVALSNSRKDIVIWNPSTKRYKKLPTSNVNVSPPTRNLDFYGFGHDPVNDDYKLVKITFLVGNPGCFGSEVNVYSAKANSWKRINKNLPDLIDIKTLYGLFASNALHWFVAGKNGSTIPELIVAVDLVTEELREIPLPGYEKAGHIVMFLDVLKGSLCLTCNYVEGFASSSRVDIWMMKEYGVRDSWTKIFTVKPSKSIGTFLFVTPVAYLKSGDQVILNRECQRFITYDLQKKRAKNVRISGLPEGFRAQSCVGSLVGLNGGWDEENEGGKRKSKDQKQGNKKKDLNRKQRDDFLSKGFKLVL